MTDKLPPNLLALFAPRPPLRYLPFSDHAAEDRKTAPITGVAQYLDKLREPDDYEPTESWLQRRDRLRLEKRDRLEKHLTEGFSQRTWNLALKGILSWPWTSQSPAAHLEGQGLTFTTDDPANDPQVRGDAFKTLFVGRLNYDTKESDLEREFGRFGPIERVRPCSHFPCRWTAFTFANRFIF